MSDAKRNDDLIRCQKCGKTDAFGYEWMGTHGGAGTMLRSCPTCGYTYTEPAKDAGKADQHGLNLADQRALALVRELASNYHCNLISGDSAMDAIVSAIL